MYNILTKGSDPMFEKYDINDLYIADINVAYPDPEVKEWDEELGDIVMLSIAGYGYLTILRKDGERFIDLQNPKIKLYDKRITNKEKCAFIKRMEPLSNYYTQEGKKKSTFSKRKVLKEAEKHYENFFQKKKTK